MKHTTFIIAGTKQRQARVNGQGMSCDMDNRDIPAAS